MLQLVVVTTLLSNRVNNAMGTATAKTSKLRIGQVWNAVTIATAKTVKMIICTTLYKH